MHYELFTKILSLCTILADGLLLVLIASFFVPALKGVRSLAGRYSAPISLTIVCAGIAFSLFYSNVVGFLPCVLCWWQRVFLYPQVVILAIGMWKRTRVEDYVIGLSVLGGLVALYHAYEQFWGSPYAPCDATGISCAYRYFTEFGYVTVPTMALTAFGLILVLSILSKRFNK